MRRAPPRASRAALATWYGRSSKSASSRIRTQSVSRKSESVRRGEISETQRKLDFLWFLPTGGDGTYLGSSTGHRQTDNRYLRQLAEATDRLGYTGVLLPTGTGCEDALVTASALILPDLSWLNWLTTLSPTGPQAVPGEGPLMSR